MLAVFVIAMLAVSAFVVAVILGNPLAVVVATLAVSALAIPVIFARTLVVCLPYLFLPFP